MSYSKMLLEQYREDSRRESRPGYQNILEDVKSLCEQTPAQAARDYRYMLDDPKTPEQRGLIKAPLGRERPAAGIINKIERPSNPAAAAEWDKAMELRAGGKGYSYRPASLQSLGTAGASQAIRRVASAGIDVPELVGPDYDKMTDYQKQTASQGVSAVRGALSGLEDIPNLTPSDFADIGKKSAESSRQAAMDLERRLASRSSDPEIASRGTFNPAADLERRAQDLAARRQAGATSKELKPELQQLMTDTKEFTKTGGVTLSNLKDTMDSQKITDLLGTDLSSGIDVATRASGAIPLATVAGVKPAQQYVSQMAQREIGKRLSSLPTEPQVNQSAERVAAAMKVDPGIASKEMEDTARNELERTGNIIRDVARRRAQIKAGEAQGARTLGQMGLLPGMKKSTGKGYVGVGR